MSSSKASAAGAIALSIAVSVSLVSINKELFEHAAVFAACLCLVMAIHFLGTCAIVFGMERCGRVPAPEEALAPERAWLGVVR